MAPAFLDQLAAFLPETVLGAGILALLLAGAAVPGRRGLSTSLGALAVLIASLGALVFVRPESASAPILLGGDWPVLVRIMVIFSASLVIFLSHDYLRRSAIPVLDYHVLVLLATLGMMVTAVAGHLLLLFLGIELMSLPLVLLVGITPGSGPSKEAALKYLLFGLTASALMMFGFSLLYGTAGTWDMGLLAERFGQGPAGMATAVALVFVLTGLAFKIGLVPCHLWLPDAYEGSPAPVAAFLATGPKVVALAVAGVLLNTVFAGQERWWFPLLWAMSVASMIWGNLAALTQHSLKRLMAYSGVAHVGYVGVALLAASRRPLEGLGSMGFYLFTYLFFTIGFFALLIWLEEALGRPPMVEDLDGLGRRHPVLAATGTLFLLALAGIPPTSGFMGKFWVFLAAVRADLTHLAVLGVLASVVGAVYYLRLVRRMFMAAGTPGRAPMEIGIGSFSVILAAAITLWFGVYPRPLLDLVRSALGF